MTESSSSSGARPGVVRAAVVVIVVSVVVRLAGSTIDLVTNPGLGIAAFPPDYPPRAVAAASSVFRLQFVADLTLTLLIALALVHLRRRRNWARGMLLGLATIDVLVSLVTVDEIGVRLSWGGYYAALTSLAVTAVVALVGGAVLAFFPAANAWIRSGVGDRTAATWMGMSTAECARAAAERLLRDHPDPGTREAIRRAPGRDPEFERWRWAVVEPYARSVVDECDADIGLIYMARYAAMAERQRMIGKGEGCPGITPAPDGIRRPAGSAPDVDEQSSEYEFWSIMGLVVEVALHVASGHESMQVTVWSAGRSE